MNNSGLGMDLFKVLGSMQGGFLNPYIKIIDSASRDIEKLGFKKIGLLGSIYIMNGEFFRKPFTDKGMEVITPKDSHKDYINRKLTEELEHGIVNEDTVNSFLSIIKEMKEEENIEAILLGCTELELLFKDVDMPVPCINVMKKQVDKMVNEVLVGKR